jgi:hypothetical protein
MSAMRIPTSYSFRITLLAALSLVGLSSCLPQPTAGVVALHFKKVAAGSEIDPKTLLTLQEIPADKYMSIPEAMQKAPIGSLMVVCWYDNESPWGPCSHITRKYSATTLLDVVTLGETIREYPLDHMNPRYAVIVLDTGITPEKLPLMFTKSKELIGKYYDVTGFPGTYYCSTLQNSLEEAMGLPKAMPFNKEWNVYLPADSLFLPHVKVRYVGVNEGSREETTPPPKLS